MENNVRRIAHGKMAYHFGNCGVLLLSDVPGWKGMLRWRSFSFTFRGRKRG
jgi:hypothetical protein